MGDRANLGVSVVMLLTFGCHSQDASEMPQPSIDAGVEAVDALEPPADLGETPAIADASPPPAAPTMYGLDATQKRRAMQLISVFENDTIVLQYDYVEALNDGRGYTCGLGFTTATGDALEVVHAYSSWVPSNPLAMYLPRLSQLAQTGSGSTTGLDGFPAAWMKAATDPLFRQVQDMQTDTESYKPALAHAMTLGLKTALGITILYDTVWMHGDGSDPDGTQALIDRATMKQSPTDEAAWLAAFLAVRRADLLNPSDQSTQGEWSMAVGRVDVLSDLLQAKNFDLSGPIMVGHGYGVTVP